MSLFPKGKGSSASKKRDLTMRGSRGFASTSVRRDIELSDGLDGSAPGASLFGPLGASAYTLPPPLGKSTTKRRGGSPARKTNSPRRGGRSLATKRASGPPAAAPPPLVRASTTVSGYYDASSGSANVIAKMLGASDAVLARTAPDSDASSFADLASGGIPVTQRDLLAILATGHDAVAFFSRVVNSAPGGTSARTNVMDSVHSAFVYANKVDVGAYGQFAPYDLVVVPANKAEQEHYIVNSRGLSHFVPGEPGEHIELSEWVRWSRNFDIMRGMKTFGMYSVGKMFRNWHAATLRAAYKNKRQHIGVGLLYGNPAFAQPMMDIQAKLAKVHGIPIFAWLRKHVAGRKTYDFDKLEKEQEEVWASSQLKLEDIVQSINNQVIEVAQHVDHEARQMLLASTSSSTDALNATAEDADSAKHRSMAQERLDSALRARKRQQALVDRSMIGDFVRFADNQVREVLFGHVVEQFELVATDITNPVRNVEMLNVSVCFDDVDGDGVVDGPVAFRPTHARVKQMFAAIQDRILQSIERLERVLFLHSVAPFLDTRASEDGGFGKHATLGFRDMLVTSTRFVTANESVDAKIATDFEACARYATVFEKLRVVEAARIGRDDPPPTEVEAEAEAADAELVDAAAAKSEEEVDEVRAEYLAIKAEFAKCKLWGQLINAVPVNSTAKHGTGIFRVQSKQLKGLLEPTVEDQTMTNKSALRQLFRTLTEQQLAINTEAIATLELRPTDLDGFATLAQEVKVLVAGESEAQIKLQLANTLQRLLRVEDVKLKAEDEFRHEDLVKSVSKRREISAEAALFVGAETDGTLKLLRERIARLDEELKELIVELEDVDSDLYALGHPYEDAQAILEEFKMDLDERKADWADYEHKLELFGQPPMTLTSVATADALFTQLDGLWSTIAGWNVRKKQWMEDAPVLGIDSEGIVREVQVVFQASYKLAKKFAKNPNSAAIKQEVDVVLAMKSILVELGNHNLQERHWKQMLALVGKEDEDYTTMTITNLIEWGLFEEGKFEEKVGDISGNASGEAGIEKALRDVEEGWKTMNFAVNPYREEDYDRVFILGGLDEVMALLEDNLVSLSTMLGSRYIAGVQDAVTTWEEKLKLLAESLDEWAMLQREWMYLDSIFCADDIKKQLPSESVRFENVNRKYIKLMRKIDANPVVIDSVQDGDKNLCFFQGAASELDAVRKALEEYLGTKRAAFPRFYFLSNDQLLEILSQTRDPTAVQPHLGKCFDAIKTVIFCEPGAGTGADLAAGVDASMMMTHMIDNIKSETVEFSNAVACAGPVEHWLLEMQKMMKKTLYDLSKQALSEYPDYEGATHRRDWLVKWPAQCVLVVDQIWWTTNVESAVRKAEAGDKAALADFLDYSIAQIAEMVDMIRSKLPKLVMTMLGALMVLDVHARETTRVLVNKKVDSMFDFEWTRQLRYYWEDDVDDVVIRQTNTYFLYSYEYIGNGGRLVITPLTDTCYMTLTGALHLGFGGAPAGPAGTGKTETTKDLAKALARQCVVFNCSDSLDIKIMGRFFKGLVSAGAWACFDEFNRINIEVLSVIAQQIMNIQSAIAKDLSRFSFEGDMVPCSKNFGVFITMNPGYAGRTELPDNLKSLFRPVAMMVPDYGLIAEIILYSQGFGEAKTLSNKMAQLYQLSSEQLSKQDHYDFGMRAVKSVLVAAGKLKAANPDTNEDLLLIRAMRDSNVPKFLEVDLPLFSGILRDLFPGIDVPFVDYGALQAAIENQISLCGLTVVPSLVTKIIQIHETQIVRHGMMVVGQSGSGKSTAQEILARSLTELKLAGEEDKTGLYQVCEQFILNPKSISAGTLYGEFNELSGEWKDGLVPYLVRTAATDVATDGPKRKWICFDGPVDAVWIENMNTVLDDNKTLCLANSERIRIPSIMHMMFEVADLKVASPATVSRCGMVYMEQVHIGEDAVLTTWLRGEADSYGPALPSMKTFLLEWTREYALPAIQFALKRCNQPIPTSGMNLIASFLKLFGQLLAHPDILALEPNKPFDGGKFDEEDEVAVAENARAAAAHAALPTKEAPARLVELCQKLFVFSFMWAIGACVDDESRPKFSEMAMEKVGSILLTAEEVGSIKLLDGKAPMFEFYVHLDKPNAEDPDLSMHYIGEAGTLRTWKSTLATTPWEFDIEMPYFELLVPTPAVTTSRYILTQLLSGAPRTMEGPQGVTTPAVLLMGNTGVGKSVVVQQFLDARVHASENLVAGEMGFVATTMNFSAQTAPTNLIEVVESKLEKKRKTLLGPPAGKRMLFFVDDMNMPALEEYGAQPPIELLRQWVDKAGYWTVTSKSIFLKNIENVAFVASMAPPGGGRMEVTERLTRHFFLLWLTNLEADAMETIFSKIFSGFLEHELPELAEAATRIVSASVSLFGKVQAGLLPTPAKSHYTFNLRDMSKVFQGILMVKPQQVPDLPALIRLWIHEEQRVFRDRLIDADDRLWFNSLLHTMATGPIGMVDGPEWEPAALESFLWGSYLHRDDMLYSEIPDGKALPAVFEELLMEYNIQNPSSEMDLVFFTDCVRHISRVCRVLMQPRGNALLVGVGGSGRKSVTRLACYMNEMACESIEVRRGYGKQEWHEDLKEILIEAGGKNQPTVFLFSDVQIVNEDFLEDINGVLNAGEVPNLFAPEDVSQILGLVRPRAAELGLRQTRDALLALFTDTVRANLHLVLCFSPTGSLFRDRCRMFPSLVNCCTIDWFDPWPEDALRSVAHRVVSVAATEGGGDPLGIVKFIEPLCDMAVSIHRSVESEALKFMTELGRMVYTTPTSYLELLKLYLSLLKEQQAKVNTNLARYVGGLHKLEEAGVQVAALNVKLTKMQPELEQASADVADLLIVLARDQKVAGEAEVLANKEADAAAIIAEEVGVMKVDCQKDLDLALPAFYAALDALKKLDKSKIQEVKALAHPPPGVVMTMEAVCVLMGEKTDWKSAKKMMGDMKFLDKLKDYDKDNIDKKKIRKMGKYMKNPDFTPEKMASVSVAAQCLTCWVHAIVIYDKVAKQVGPKKAALAAASANLLEVQGKVDAKLAELAKIKGKLADLQAQYDAAIAKKGALAYKAQQTTIKLGRATELIGGLGGEQVRWTASSERLSKQKDELVGNVMLCGGALAYLGPFTAQFRETIASGWVERCTELALPVAGNFSLQDSLADPVDVRQWRVCGLPADNFSTENGLMATSASRWPLCIDPQGQANRWVKAMNRGALEVSKLSDPNFMRTLENAIRYGTPALLENVGEVLDPALEPILLKQVFKKSGQWLLRLGDQDIPYDANFKLFITTKLPNPHYMPEVCIKVTIINFTVTLFGLEEQMLVEVMRNERKDLADKSDQLVVAIAKCKNQLTDVEKAILKLLAEVKAEDMLDDDQLIVNLKQSKTTSTEVGIALAAAEETSAEIAATREGYRSIATRSAVIYFVIASLSSVNSMYQYSLQYFKNVCNMVMKRAEPQPTTEERVEVLIADISMAMFISICRGIFERDKLLFAYKIAIDVQRQRGELTDDSWNTFLAGVTTQATEEKPPCYESLTTKEWDVLCGLHHITATLGGVYEACIADASGKLLKAYLESKSPYDDEAVYHSADSNPAFKAMTSFERLLLVRLLHEDKLTDAVRVFVGEQLGQKFTESPPFDIAAAYEDSNADTPLIFVLSSGADPKEYLIRLAAQYDKNEQNGLHLLSLGQGQGPKAEKFMASSRKSGDWVCLQNCHLAVSWLPDLELIIEGWQTDHDQKGHKSFRLWLTSMPTAAFPVPVLQNGIKITNEPPLGLRANLRQNFLNMTEEDFSGIEEGKENAWHRLLFAVVFYNAVCTERKKFGPVGWNIAYGWMQSDLNTGILMLRNYLNEQKEVPYDTIVNMVGAICFGGRCTDKWDKRCNVSILRHYIVPAVLGDSFKYSQNGKYYSPATQVKSEVMEYIDGLPVIDEPDVFGLHENANITFQQQQTRRMCSTLITMMGGGSGGGASNNDEKVKSLAKAFLQKFPPILDDDNAHATTYARIEDGSVNSVGVVCSQEKVRFNNLRRAVEKHLSDLQKAIVGTIVMSLPMEILYNCFVYNTLPDAWSEDGEGYPSLKPLSSWSNDFLDRLEFIGDWLCKGPPDTFCISYFFFPQGFMTGVKQTFSRKTQIAIDILTFKTNLTRKQPEEITAPPDVGVYLHGAFMQGARFDQSQMLMAESFPGVLFDVMPVINIEPIKKADYTPKNIYDIPFYKTSRRAGTLSTTGHSTNFVMPLKIPSKKSQDRAYNNALSPFCLLATSPSPSRSSPPSPPPRLQIGSAAVWRSSRCLTTDCRKLYIYID